MHKLSKFTDEYKNKVITAIKAGAKPVAAAESAGITYRTFFNWKRKAADGNVEYAAFFERLTQAAAEHQNSLVRGLNMLAGEMDYRALTYLLTNRYAWGQDTAILIERFLTVAEEVLDHTQFEKLEQAIIDGALDLDS